MELTLPVTLALLGAVLGASFLNERVTARRAGATLAVLAGLAVLRL